MAFALLTLALFINSGLHAAGVPFGGILPGQGIIRKNIVSLNEKKYQNLIRQQTDYSCGAASLATILKYGYGLDASEDSVLRGMFKIANAKEAKRKGFSMLNMKNYLKTLGLRGRGYRTPATQLERIRIPVIVLLNIKGYSHFVVFKKAAGGKVYIADPALGNKVIPKQEFVAGWNGVVFAVVRNDFNSKSVLLDPDEPPVADKRFALDHAKRQVPVEAGNIHIRRQFDCVACF